MIRAKEIAAACCLAVAAGCATLPDTEFLSERYVAQSARFENARGPLTARRSAAIVAELKRRSGDLDVLDKQIALEQEIVGSPLVVGNRVTLLEDGPATYKAMLAAIAGAKDHVNIESYIIEDGEAGERFAEALLERQAHGVQVNVIYDSVGALATAPAFFGRLSQAGVNVLEFNPVNPASLKKAWAPNHRDHRKLLVVDGRAAFLGGINISNVYSAGSGVGRSRPGPDPAGGWRDTDIEIEGPAVAEFQKLFLDTWEKQHGKTLAARDYLPRIASPGTEIVRAVGSTPDDPYSLIYLTLISAITNAEKQLYITNAYCAPSHNQVDLLVAAAARGVDVRILVPGPHNDQPLTKSAGRGAYGDLLKGGVKMFEYDPTMIHTKTIVVDGLFSVFGSSNFDSRSAQANEELDITVYDEGFGAGMDAVFLRDLEQAHPYRLEDFQKRPARQRISEWLIAPFAPLL